METKTVTVEYDAIHKLIRMKWEAKVIAKDVRDAFRTIDDLLNRSEQPLYVLVDISSQPNFPISDTIVGALFGPYRNPKLIGWLIVGKTVIATMIERVLSTTTNINNVLWFNTEAEALAYAARHKDTAAPVSKTNPK